MVKMKKCEQCGHLYDDKFEQCPHCSQKITKEICKIVMPVAAISVLIIAALAAIFCSTKDPHDISSEILGDQYPYTIDKMRIECVSDYPESVYVIDQEGSKYAVNGNAYNYFLNNNDKNFKGYTSEILKNGKTDAVILKKGLDFCRE